MCILRLDNPGNLLKKEVKTEDFWSCMRQENDTDTFVLTEALSNILDF